MGAPNQSWWQRLLSRFKDDDPLSPEELDRLRALFRSRYNSFRLLLTANNRALEVMTEMERALEGSDPIDMTFVRSGSTRVSASVLQMIGHLKRIAPDKYEQLDERFADIQQRIQTRLDQGRPDEALPLVVPFVELGAVDADRVGSKMALLAELGRATDVRVPAGFSTTTRASSSFFEHQGLETEINRVLQAGGVLEVDELAETSGRLQRLVLEAEVPGDLAAALEEHYRGLEATAGQGVVVALRSSALGEDELGLSHAGMYDSVFGVTADNLLASFKEVLASKYSARAMRYRQEHGIRDDEAVMCVGCMPVVDAVASGVAYSGNPLDAGDDSVIVHSVWGLPHAVVHGSAETDVFVVERGEPPTIVERRVAHKAERRVFSPTQRKNVVEPTGDRADRVSLTDEQALALARQIIEIEGHYGAPQDVEWALEKDGGLTVLQTRPLAQREPARRPDELAVDPRELGEVLMIGGDTASPGAGAGEVFLVRTEADLNQFPAGAVMLAHQSAPDWAVVLDKAAAVVTEHGGIVGHLATVAREQGVPALFGLTDAVAELEPGRMVTVDAGRRVVFDGRVEGVLLEKPAPNPIPGSPVHRLLAKVSELVVPLTLLDPEASEFKAANCQTLHDITRFCHEKSVREMFRFGKDNKFPEKSSRQLKYEVPMQFWIIDLADGLEEAEPDPRYVQFADVVSIPMLALWRGMYAMEWEGPPKVDAKGFMDLVNQSATNPWLSPAVPSAFSVKNYFMISKNFCSVQSRFGYHLAGVEALVGPRAMENYAAFQFAAGGTGPERMARRARLIAEILVEKQFRAEAVRDSVRARIEGFPQEFMEQRLAVLGFLMIHTRQLDMAMVNDAAVGSHRRKLLEQIDELGLAAD